jgi:hypothetical protein
MRARKRDEKGVMTVLVALISVSALMMVGLVLDGGQLRLDNRVSKGVTDMAARAGIARLPFGPWSGVCKARQFLLSNAKGFSSFDAGSETWSTVAGGLIGSDPCPAVASAADAVACAPNAPATWAKLQATAGSGRFTIEIQSGYVLPDPRFPNDAAVGDAGVAEMGSCDNLAVILTERQESRFAQVKGRASTNVRVRSVGRLNSTQTLDFIAALQLLERNKCNVLQVGGNGTRVIAQPYNTYPGTIQIDSAGDTGTCPSPILNSQATSGGPAVLACSANSTNVDCRPGIGTRPARIGIYAINFNAPESILSTGYPSTYGDVRAVASPRTGRKFTDLRYRANVAALDDDAKSVLTGNGGLPPGCTSVSVLTSTCTGNGLTWLVVQDCSALGTFFSAVLGRTAMQNIWFKCDLNVTTPLTLTGLNSYIVVTGKLAVNSVLTITDPRKVYIGGEATGNKVGLDLTGSGTLNMNTGGFATCSLRTLPGHSNRLVVGNGSLKVASGFTARMCQTFTFMASGYGKVPSTNGTLPCANACSNYSGTVVVTSGAAVDLSAPNEITGRLPDPAELLTTNPFEDLGLWVEAGGATNGLTGGALTTLRGVFFLPNADPFTLAGGGSLPIDLSAQFVSTSLKVQGGATVNLVPNPEDSIPVTIYTTLLVR